MCARPLPSTTRLQSKRNSSGQCWSRWGWQQPLTWILDRAWWGCREVVGPQASRDGVELGKDYMSLWALAERGPGSWGMIGRRSRPAWDAGEWWGRLQGKVTIELGLCAVFPKVLFLMHECPGDLLTSFPSSRQAPFCLQDSKLFSLLGTRWVRGYQAPTHRFMCGASLMSSGYLGWTKCSFEFFCKMLQKNLK